MTPEHREELRAQIVAQPDLAIDLICHLEALADQAETLSAANERLNARIRKEEPAVADQTEVIKALATAAAAVLRECVGRPLAAGAGYRITEPSWKSLSGLASAIEPTLGAIDSPAAHKAA
jgi:hypothetical protein